MINNPWLALVLVGALWGGTNPFLKKGIENVQVDNPAIKVMTEFKILFSRWKYLCPFLLNQCGSVVYFFALSQSDLSLAVPVANSLTFLFTALTGHLLGEEVENKGTFLGMSLVLAGISLCVLDK